MLIVVKTNACTGRSFSANNFLLYHFRFWILSLMNYFFFLPFVDICSDNCRTSIFDLHRSCSNCSSDLCLICCQEIRDGNLQGGGEAVVVQYISQGLDYMHGEKEEIVEKSAEVQPKDHVRTGSEWKANEDGSISCHCGNGILVLKCIFPENEISDLVDKAEKIAKTCELLDVGTTSLRGCPCFDSNGNVDLSNPNLLKAASREDSYDNYLYCPWAKDIQHDDLKHFQHHWMKAEPVLVRNVLETASGLSWEPMVMWRAFRQIKKLKHETHLDVQAIDCLDGCQVSLMAYCFLCLL